MSMTRARELASTIARNLKGDANTDWQRCGPQLTALIGELTLPKKPAFDRVGERGQAILLPAICDWVAWKVVQFDEEYGWNFNQDEEGGGPDRMPDQYEDVLLYAFGHSMARHILTGELKML